MREVGNWEKQRSGKGSAESKDSQLANVRFRINDSTTESHVVTLSQHVVTLKQSASSQSAFKVRGAAPFRLQCSVSSRNTMSSRDTSNITRSEVGLPSRPSSAESLEKRGRSQRELINYQQETTGAWCSGRSPLKICLLPALPLDGWNHGTFVETPLRYSM